MLAIIGRRIIFLPVCY